MKKYTLTLLALAFFGSFWMDSYLGTTGWGCAKICLGAIPDLLKGQLSQIYLSIFVVTNVYTVYIILSMMFDFKDGADYLKLVGLILILHLLSWPIIKQLDLEFYYIEFGYYLWAASIILIWLFYTIDRPINRRNVVKWEKKSK